MYQYFFNHIFIWERYQVKNFQERSIWNQVWAANTHHIIIMVFSAYNMIYPACDDPYPFKAIKDDLCLLQVDKKHVYCILITLSYFIYDFIISIFVSEFNDREFLAHHFMGLSATVCCLVPGWGTICVGQLTIMMEYSTPYVNYR